MSAVEPTHVPAEQRGPGAPNRILSRVPILERDPEGRMLDTGRTEPLLDVLVRQMRAGATVADACNAANPPVARSTWFSWQRRGRIIRERLDAGLEDGTGLTDVDLACLEFVDRGKRAQAEAKTEAVLAIRRAIVGYDDVETVVTTVEEPFVVTNADGSQETVMRTKTTTTRKSRKVWSWQAAMTWLERRYGAEYARRMVDAIGAGEGGEDEGEHEEAEHERGRATELLEHLDELRAKREQAEREALARGDAIDVHSSENGNGHSGANTDG